MEDEATGDRFLVYASDKAARLEIRFQGETLWMTRAQIADLFGRGRTVITKHISNILEEADLEEASSVQKLHTTQGRPATIYSLDMVISVGYRVSSTQATLFRRWATSVLVQYAKKGFVVDAKRLRAADNASRIAYQIGQGSAKVSRSARRWHDTRVSAGDFGCARNYCDCAEVLN